MELIRSLRDKHETKVQQDIIREAECVITVSDFADELYIAYNGVPLVPIKVTWTSKEILEELNLLRQNFIKAKSKDLKTSLIN